MKSGAPINFTKTAAKFGWKQCSEWHWQIRIGDEDFNYWPHVGKYRWRGTTHLNYNRRAVEMMVVEMKRMLALPASPPPPTFKEVREEDTSPPWC